MNKRTYRLLQSTLAMVSFAVFFFSFYLQYVKGLVPCPLCIMQRVCVGALLFLGLMALNTQTMARAKLVTFLQMFFAIAGLFFACRQLWLQSMLPSSEAAVCMPGIEMMLKYFPWRELVHIFLWGSSHCGDITWTAKGLSMAAWSAIYFGGMLFILGVIFCRLIFSIQIYDER